MITIIKYNGKFRQGVFKTMKNLKLIILTAFIFILSGSACHAIKIGLYTHYNDNVTAGVSRGGVVENAQTGKYILVLTRMKPYKFKKRGDFIQVEIDKKLYRIKSKEIVVKTTQNSGLVFTKNRWYRGRLKILNDRKGLTVINELGLEDYIKGVVPAEMPTSWEIEAHKAQAIAARSYAAANMGKRMEYGYDLKDTPQDQNYIGVSAETIRTNRAVESTQGQVLVYNGKIIPAYYHASAGGSTLSAKRVWGKDLPYIKAVRSFDDGVPKNGHRVGMSQNGAQILAKRGYSAYQILGYFYNNVMLRKMY